MTRCEILHIVYSHDVFYTIFSIRGIKKLDIICLELRLRALKQFLISMVRNTRVLRNIRKSQKKINDYVLKKLCKEKNKAFFVDFEHAFLENP